MKPAPHSCLHHGHVWLETDGTPYSRHRGRTQADVNVTCKHCKTTATLKARAQFSGKRPPGMPVDQTIPAPFKKVLDAALAAADKPPSGSAPMK